MEREGRPARAAMDRRRFLKSSAGVVAFGGLFLVVGCGDDDTTAVGTPGSALRTAISRPTVPSGAAAALVPAAAPAATVAPRPTTGSLYDRLGGHAAIEQLITDFLPTVVFDNRINTFFGSVNATALGGLLIDFIGTTTGGPEKYTGRTMKASHATLKIQKTHFDALMEDLGKAMDKQQMPAKERGELTALLNPMAADIVTA
jgi:hemoglobin